MSQLRFGVYLPQLRMPFDRILERVQVAERTGFDSAWFMDHLLAPAIPEADVLEAWTLTAALAARTDTIRLGHLVGCDPFRHPAVLAKQAATVDVVSEGRLDLGLGWGSVEDELRRFGFGPQARRVRAARLRETLEVLPRLFSGEEVEYVGEHLHLDGAICRPTPVQDPVPIHLGGAGPTLTMPLVAEFAHWWNVPSYAADRLEELRPQAGDARISVQHPIGLVVDESQREEVEAKARRRFGSWGGLITGTPDEVAAGLSRRAAAGAELFVLQFSDFGTPETLEAFMTEVAPRVGTEVTA